MKRMFTCFLVFVCTEFTFSQTMIDMRSLICNDSVWELNGKPYTGQAAYSFSCWKLGEKAVWDHVWGTCPGCCDKYELISYFQNGIYVKSDTMLYSGKLIYYYPLLGFCYMQGRVKNGDRVGKWLVYGLSKETNDTIVELKETLFYKKGHLYKSKTVKKDHKNKLK